MGKRLRFKSVALYSFLVLGIAASSFAAPRQMENLSRGLVASNVGNGMLVSWRLLGTDAPTTSFVLYRDGSKIADISGTQGTNYLDASGKATSKYAVAAVVDGVEGPQAGLSVVLDKTVSNSGRSVPYKTIKLEVPAAQTMPNGERCTYTPNDASAADLDGDGELEIILKWDPSNAHDNSQTGYTGTVFIDAYKLDGTRLWRIDLGKNIRAGAHYTQFQVFDYDGDGKAEMIVKTADGTIDGTGKAIGNASIDNRDGNGLVLKGNEFLTVFEGSTGAAITTIDYVPKRNINQSVKGKNGKGYWGDDYGNRSERYIAATAYLDGVHPSAIFIRGYYSASYVVAYDFDGKLLKQRWYHKSEDPGQGLYEQGNHNITTGDIDGDGYDEIVFGAAALNHDGSLRYRTGFGHGDAGHLGDLDPDIPGLEFFGVQEHKDAKYTDDLRDKDGKVIWGGAQHGDDNGRGIAADIDSTQRGYEVWSSKGGGLHNIKGQVLGAPALSMNFRIYFDGDVYDELLDGGYVTKYVSAKTDPAVYFDAGKALGAAGCNGTKNTPTLVADLFGDWREEMVLRSEKDPSVLYIVSTPVTSPHRVYTLMHDAVYRTAIAWQNTAYNQPPHLGYYLPDAVKNLKKPDIYVVGEGAPAYVPENSNDTTKVNIPVVNDGNSQMDASAPKEGLGVFEATNAGFLDKGYYNFENNISSYGVWEIFSPKTATTTLKVRFANGGTSNRDMMVSINGASAGTISFSATTWTTYEEASIEVTLKAGVNILKLASLSSDGGPNVDMFTFAMDGVEIYDGTQKVPEEIPGDKTFIHENAAFGLNAFNPYTGLLRTNRAGMAEVYVYDMRGKLVGSVYQNVPAGISVVDINHAMIPQGMYMVTVKLNGKVIAKQKFLEK